MQEASAQARLPELRGLRRNPGLRSTVVCLGPTVAQKHHYAVNADQKKCHFASWTLSLFVKRQAFSSKFDVTPGTVQQLKARLGSWPKLESFAHRDASLAMLQTGSGSVRLPIDTYVRALEPPRHERKYSQALQTGLPGAERIFLKA